MKAFKGNFFDGLVFLRIFTRLLMVNFSINVFRGVTGIISFENLFDNRQFIVINILLPSFFEKQIFDFF